MKTYLLFAFTLTFFCSIIKSQVPAGYIGKYKLNNETVDISGNGYNGTLTSTSATINRLGTAGTATSFTAGSSSGTLPATMVTAMQNNFSVSFWFNTSMVGAGGSQWYHGNSLIDAEVSGSTNDWGICLIDGGKVCFGIGNPDVTIKSPINTYNNNVWHFVTATRNQTSGEIILYIDGAQSASTTGVTTAALTSPAIVGIGRSSAMSNGSYTGSIDDLLIYNRTLTATEVTNLYNAEVGSPLPLTWISFTGTIANNKAILNWVVNNTSNNNYFEVEHAKDGLNFSVKGTVADNNRIVLSNANSFVFNDTDLLSEGNHYYRIKQVDANGKYSFSTTIKLKAG